MKKAIKLFLATCLSLCLAACSSSGPNSVEVAPDVDFKLLDVMQVSNSGTNSLYYYFLASVENESSEDYYMSNLNYSITDTHKDEHQAILPIDRYKTTIVNTLSPDQSTFIYGYIGFPNQSQNGVGLYFPTQDTFISLSSVPNKKIKNTDLSVPEESSYVLYEDKDLRISVDSSDLSMGWKDDQFRIDGLNITYENKTDGYLVVPFIEPVCTMAGYKTDDLGNGSSYVGMDVDELKKQSFMKDGIVQRTEEFTADTLGYQLFYLTGKQEVPCTISFQFEKDQIPDLSHAGTVSIRLRSASLGYDQKISVNP